MKLYIGQTKTIEGVMFHYSGDDHTVESTYYSNLELVGMTKEAPEYGEALKNL